MIVATARFEALTARLVEKAQVLATARLAQGRAGASRWRDARLVWPLFSGDR